MLIDVPDDLGDPAWDGQTLEITAGQIYLFHYVARGHTRGPEILNGWDEGVSETTNSDLSKGAAIGLKIPPMSFTVPFS